MPTHRLHPLHGFSEKSQIGSSPKVFHKIEAHAADAAFVHLLKIFIFIGVVDDRGAAAAAFRARDRVERDAHVRAMAAGVARTCASRSTRSRARKRSEEH